MIKRTLKLIAKNPIIVVPYIVFIGVDFIMSRFIVKLEDMAVKSGNIAAAANKAMGFWILIMVISILFASGYGSMIGGSVKGRKFKFKDFFTDIDHFLGRMMLYFVMLSFMAMSFLLIITITVFPIFAASSVGAIDNKGAVAVLSSIGVGSLIVFIYPRLILWYPAIFIDDAGVVDALKKGLITSKKCYWKLAVTTLVSILPSLIYTIITSMMNNSVPANSSSELTLSYIMYMVINIIVSFFVFVYIFVIYYTIKSEKDT